MRVYLDHNATTPLRPEARARWLDVADRLAGNPSSVHAGGRAARSIVDDARERIAAVLGVDEDELLFTSGGTEANNLALFGVLEAIGPGSGLVTTAVEHSSVLRAARALEAEGHPLVVTRVDSAGSPEADELAAAVQASSPALLSVMAANNEVGSVPDLAALAALTVGAGGPLFHTDAVQALGRLPVDLEAWGVDLASFSGHKVGAPVGVGVLWRRKSVRLRPRLHGGGQEQDLRPGTEDVCGIAALAIAIEAAVREREVFARATNELVSFLWDEIVSAIPAARLLGPGLDQRRLPNTLCILLPELDGKVGVTRLDLEGLEVSAGSACASGSIEPSHVLTAMGCDEHAARSGVRLSLGRTTTREECAHAANRLKKLFAASRAT